MTIARACVPKAQEKQLDLELCVNQCVQMTQGSVGALLADPRARSGAAL